MMQQDAAQPVTRATLFQIRTGRHHVDTPDTIAAAVQGSGATIEKVRTFEGSVVVYCWHTNGDILRATVNQRFGKNFSVRKDDRNWKPFAAKRGAIV